MGRQSVWFYGCIALLVFDRFMTTATAVEAPTDDGLIGRAIGEFQPPWRAEEGALRGVVIVIHPAGGGEASIDQRKADEFSLLTAAHLYHLVRQARGTPVLARVDGRVIPGAENGVDHALASRCESARAQLVVTIDTVGGNGAGETSPIGPAVVPSSHHALSEVFAKAVGEAGDLAVVHGAESQALDLPAVVVKLPLPKGPIVGLDAAPMHQHRAAKLYQGLARFIREHRDALDRRRTDRNRERDGDEGNMAPLHPLGTRGSRLRQAARSIWPEGDLPARRAAWFCEALAKAALSDRTLVYFNPQIEQEGDAVVIRGATTIEGLLGTCEEALSAVGVRNIRNEMRLLPEQGRTDGKWFGVCVAPMALNYNRPAESGGPQTQLLYGEPVFLLDREAGFYLVQGGEGYWGWVREASVRPMDRDAFRQYTTGEQAVLLDDVQTAERRLSRGSRLFVAAIEGQKVTLRSPDGEWCEVPRDKVRLTGEDELAARPRAALDLLYTPYLFAGRSSLGLDCSGLVGGVCDQQGYPLARDAAQQFLSGRLVATRWYRDDLRPGDRVYFINDSGKISHTGLAMNGTHFIHCSPPAVQINSLHEGDRLYSEGWDRQFLGAKRP